MPRIRVENDDREFYRPLARNDGDAAKHKAIDATKDVFMVALDFRVGGLEPAYAAGRVSEDI